MERRAELRRDTDAAREFSERGRQPLQRKTPLQAIHEVALKRSKPLRAATGFGAMEAAAAAKPSPPPELTMRKALATPFRARRPARARLCWRCLQRDATGWHHWVPAEHLRVMMAGLALVRGWTPRQAQRRLRDWLRDERNLTPACHSCHMKGEQTISNRWRAEEIPQRAREFAAEVDAELTDAGRRAEAALRLEQYP